MEKRWGVDGELEEIWIDISSYFGKLSHSLLSPLPPFFKHNSPSPFIIDRPPGSPLSKHMK